MATKGHVQVIVPHLTESYSSQVAAILVSLSLSFFSLSLSLCFFVGPLAIKELNSSEVILISSEYIVACCVLCSSVYSLFRNENLFK